MRIAGICLLAVLALTVGGMDRELRKIRDRNNAGSIQTVSDSRVRRTLNQQRADGSWPGIDYRHQGRGSWHPAKHLARLRLLAAGYAAPESKFFRNRELLAAVLRGLDFWAERDPQSPNWWYSEIGTPRQLLDTLLLLGDDLPPEYPEKFRAILDRSRPGMTGQNKVWLAGIHLLKGVLYQRPELVREGREQILSELRLAASGREGIQSDWSFHQHGAQLQFGNYGLAYFTEMVRWLSVLSRSAYAFPPDRVEVLQNYYRNGLRWVLFDRQMDFSACGRQHAARFPFQKYRECVDAAARLRRGIGEENPAEKEEFGFSGCRYFYDSDFLVFRTPEFYCSVKMSSRRIRGSETVNAENQLGRLTGHGATMLMSRRRELEEIGALWDWRKIPGVTAVQDDSSLFCRNPGWDNREEWVGGLSDGEVGFCAMEFDNGELTAKKSYFFPGSGMVCVGSGIRSRIDAPVVTAAAQFRALGELKRDPCSGTVANGGFSWRILSAPGAEIRTGIHDVTGNWKRVTAALSAAPVRGKIFFLYLDHGRRPANGRYAYAVTPVGRSCDAVLLKTSSGSIHAIACCGAVMAAFFRPGWAEFPDGTRLTAEQPCLLMVRGDRLYAADPGRKLEALKVRCNARSYRIPLPQGRLAGSTVSLPLSSKTN